MSILVFVVQRGVGTERRAGSRDVSEVELTEFGDGLGQGGGAPLERGWPRDACGISGVVDWMGVMLVTAMERVGAKHECELRKWRPVW